MSKRSVLQNIHNYPFYSKSTQSNKEFINIYEKKYDKAKGKGKKKKHATRNLGHHLTDEFKENRPVDMTTYYEQRRRHKKAKQKAYNYRRKNGE